MDPGLPPSNPRSRRCSSASSTSSGDPPPPAPPQRGAHRRAHSETTFLRLPDDILFDSDADFGIADIDLPSFSDESSGGRSEQPAMTGEKPRPVGKPPSGAHIRSLSVDAAFFEGLAILEGTAPSENNSSRRAHHRHSSSMDGSMSPFEAESPSPSDYAKKVMAADQLAELTLIDPKRAKRILANRQSAARSKERKIRYAGELERKVHTLQAEATTLSAQLTQLQRDSTGLTAENKELKLRLQALEQQAHLHEALNEKLREEVQRLKLVSGQVPPGNGNAFNRGFQQPIPQFYFQSQQLHNPGGRQGQQLQTSQLSSNGHPLVPQSPDDSMDCM